MKENPGIQAKWDRGCLRGSLASSKLAKGKEAWNRMETLISEQEMVWKAAHSVARTHSAVVIL